MSIWNRLFGPKSTQGHGPGSAPGPVSQVHMTEMCTSCGNQIELLRKRNEIRNAISPEDLLGIACSRCWADYTNLSGALLSADSADCLDGGVRWIKIDEQTSLTLDRSQREIDNQTVHDYIAGLVATTPGAAKIFQARHSIYRQLRGTACDSREEALAKVMASVIEKSGSLAEGSTLRLCLHSCQHALVLALMAGRHRWSERCYLVDTQNYLYDFSLFEY